MVGCTIDVGTKIYAARVDALHQNTYQVLSGLAHNAADTEEHNDGDIQGCTKKNFYAKFQLFISKLKKIN